jgi:hypothetical protein
MDNGSSTSDHSAATAAAQRELLDTIAREVALFGTGDGEHGLEPRVLVALAMVRR